MVPSTLEETSYMRRYRRCDGHYIRYDIPGVVTGIRFAEADSAKDAELIAEALNAFEKQRVGKELFIQPGKSYVDKQGLVHDISIRLSERKLEDWGGDWFQDQNEFIYNETGVWRAPNGFKKSDAFDLVKEVPTPNGE